MKEATASQNEPILILEALGQIGDKQAITVLKKYKGLGYTKPDLNKILFQLGDSETIDTMRKQEESKRKYEEKKRYWEDRSEIAMLLSRLKISPEKDGKKYKEYLLKYSGEHVHDLYSNINLERVSDLIAEWCKSEGIPDCKKLQNIPSEFDGYYLHFYWFRFEHHAIVVRFGENSYSFIITVRND